MDRITVPGKCSKTGIDIAWECALVGGQWMCQAIIKRDKAQLAANAGGGASGNSSPRTQRIPNFSVPDDLHCPGCGIRKARWRYYKCGGCQMLNCLGSMHRGKDDPGETFVTCGNCKRTGPIKGVIEYIDAQRPAAPTLPRAPATPEQARKLLK